MATLTHLPPELLLRILSHLDLLTHTRLSQTCRTLHNLVFSPTVFISLRLHHHNTNQSAFEHFLESVKPVLIELELIECGFVTSQSLLIIAKHSLSNYQLFIDK